MAVGQDQVGSACRGRLDLGDDFTFGNPVAGSPTFGRQPTETYELYLEWSF